MILNEIPYPKLRRIVHSKYLDIFAVSIILVTSISLGYHKTFYYKSNPLFNIDYEQWSNMLSKGAFPLGIFSIVVACFSMMSARLICKQSNIGNIIGIFTTICVCFIDFALGNKSAVITYPLTFILSIYGSIKWSKGVLIKQKDKLYFWIVAIGMIVGYGLTFIGFYAFDTSLSWYSDLKSKLLFHSIAITFGISIVSNTATAFKYQETWLGWLIYNIIQVIKNTLLFNWANVGKYLFYIINVVLTFFDWKFNKDKK
ncbi:nicotinamide mononucleotide transporter family protein [Pseudotenacibaculum sp. MALMAid0570]|uniref:nicotinamide mononucleotide transporter family protein n=1 Tax=Pseudotenacibaculum sp. MALMAid0570 TaxID=3143938 RepID=UPI0032DE8158